jgi:CSLREA domain-containing protein
MTRGWIVSLGASLALQSAAWGATLTVDTTVDSPDAKPGDGKCVSKKGGCSLRAAIQEANASSLSSTIELPAGQYKLDVAPGGGADFAESGDLFLQGEITIDGGGPQNTGVDAGGIDRVFEVGQGSTVSISDLAVTNGLAKGADGGGILNRGDLKLDNVVLSKNRASTSPGVAATGRGGALFNEGNVTALQLHVEGNQADGRGGGMFNGGRAALKLSNAKLISNRSLTDSGGALFNEGDLELLFSSVRHNKAMAGGAGIANVKGRVKALDSTIAGNRTETEGGGLQTSGDARLTNTTLSSNEAARDGGAIQNRDGGTVALNNVTIARNRAGTKGAGTGGGFVNEKAATFQAANSLIADNSASQGAAPDCSGVLSSEGYLLIGSQAGCTIQGSTQGNVYGVKAQLDRLAPNNGPTASMALLAGSAAIDAGNPAKPTGADGACAPADQRGVARPQPGSAQGVARCDIGAYELDPKAPPVAGPKRGRAGAGKQGGGGPKAAP